MSTSEVSHAGQVLQWLRSYVSEPHRELGRSGPVCPFVPLSLKTGALTFVVHEEIDGSDPQAMSDLLRAYMADFAATAPESSTELRRRSLMIVVPNVPDERLHVLDLVHGEIKDEMVRNSLMLGQFHLRCPDTAVRNPEFRVSIAPLPCFAIRHMAPHDILFLHDEKSWFVEYRRKFGNEYLLGRIKDPLMLDLYHSAQNRLEEE
ncbi:hypothetical protein HS041_36605 [Planomonospora sp. ID67723]|uniref:DUF6875 domain-containing protein n=1 Tax=Planomonospora sp. ID67723 TaxID=2738134 RepID=UPI0018C3623E|nr:hypothetical protein [Planomonospora sp. ID67723]MBG0833227.1 hypothetical protein [Planomonospora sp. ID67723]